MKREKSCIVKCILEGQSESSRTGRIPALQVRGTDVQEEWNRASCVSLRDAFYLEENENDKTVQYEIKQN